MQYEQTPYPTIVATAYHVLIIWVTNYIEFSQSINFIQQTLFNAQ